MRSPIGGWVENMRSTSPGLIGSAMYMCAMDALARRIGVVFGQRSTLWWDLPLRDSFELLRKIGKVLDLRVVVDIIAGASAGGINGVILARALGRLHAERLAAAT